MQSNSFARELALLVLGQISENDSKDLLSLSIENILQKALDSLMEHIRERLDSCAFELERANQNLVDSELKNVSNDSLLDVKKHLKSTVFDAENALNQLSATLDMPRLLVLGHQENIRKEAIKRIDSVLRQRQSIDKRLDQVMEGWRLKRLPRIDRDILRLAVIDLMVLKTPAPVACNEAVELANRYSDDQGRRMINGVLRRLQDASFSNLN